MRPITRIGLIALGLLAAVAPVASVHASEDTWQFDATIYAWIPAIGGETQFPTGAGGPSIDIDARDVLRKLDMAFMATLGARRGRWGGYADWVYSDLSAQRTGTRMLDTDQTLSWSLAGPGSVPGLARSGMVETSVTNWDAIVGVRGRARVDGQARWFLPYALDFGTGASRRTWQSIIGVGYSFDAGQAILAWRYLDYTFEPAEALQSLTFNGLAPGFTFRS